MPDGYKQAYDPFVFKHRGKDYLIISESKSLYLPFYAFVFTLTESMDKIVPGSKVELPPMEGFHEKSFLFERKEKSI